MPKLKLASERSGRFYVRGTVTCPVCARPLTMLDLGDVDDAFRLRCDGCGAVSTHRKAAVLVDIRRERRRTHRPL